MNVGFEEIENIEIKQLSLKQRHCLKKCYLERNEESTISTMLKINRFFTTSEKSGLYQDDQTFFVYTNISRYSYFFFILG